MKIEPLSDYVLIERKKEKDKTKSGLFLPSNSNKEGTEEGTIVAVGSGRVLENGNILKSSLKRGDKVIFQKYGPNEIKMDDKEYLIVSENDILAVIK